MEDNEKLFRNLLMILKMFKNRPYHLAKYLVDNNAFDHKFIEKIINSQKLNDISEKEANSFFPDQMSVYFLDITQMNDYYNSLTEDIIEEPKKKSKEELTTNLNSKLDLLIKEERYEEAARIRDYMNKNNIKRIF